MMTPETLAFGDYPFRSPWHSHRAHKSPKTYFQTVCSGKQVLLWSQTLRNPTTVCDGWVSLDSESTHDVEAVLRAASWNFMWLTLISSRIGIRLTSDNAISKAKARSSLWSQQTVQRGQSWSPRMSVCIWVFTLLGSSRIQSYPGVHLA